MTLKTYSDYITSYQEYGGFDVKLVVENRIILVHRLILSAGSRFLKILLKDLELDEEPATLMLPDFTFDEVNCFVETLYNSGKVNNLVHLTSLLDLLKFNHLILNPVKEPDESKESVRLLLDDEIKQEINIDTMISETSEETALFDDYEKMESKDFLTEPEVKVKSKKVKTKVPRKKRKAPPQDSDDPGLLPIADSTEIAKKKRNAYTVFRCEHCDYTSKKKKGLNTHIDAHHKDIWYYCPFENCDKKYRTKQYLASHKSLNHKGHLFYCDKCSFSTRFKDALKLHIMKKHAGVKFMCERCGHEAPNPQSLGYHIKIVHEGKTYPCDVCEFVGASYSSMMHHKVRQHAKKTFMCEQCSLSFGDRGGLNSHVKRVHTMDLLRCSYCDFSTKLKWSMKRHKESKHKLELAAEQKAAANTAAGDEPLAQAASAHTYDYLGHAPPLPLDLIATGLSQPRPATST